MEDVIAVEVRLADGASRFFVTWGRIQDAVDPEPVERLVLAEAGKFALGGEPVSARVCDTLREAADSADAPYFYECFFHFCQERIPYGTGYGEWRAAKERAMSHGSDIAHCGAPPAARDG